MKRNSPSEIDADLDRLSDLPVEAVFSVGGCVYQKKLFAMDSMPASIFRNACMGIGSRGDKWEYVRKQIRNGWPLVVYEKEERLARKEHQCPPPSRHTSSSSKPNDNEPPAAYLTLRRGDAQ